MSSTLKVLLSVLMWGSIGVFVKNISLGAVQIAFLRGIIGTIFLGLIILIKKYFEKKNNEDDSDSKDKLVLDRNVLILILSGVAIGLNWVFLFNSYNYTTVSNATIIYYLAPIIVIILSPIFLKEKLTLKRVMAVVFSMCGLILIVNTQLDSSLSQNLIKGVINAFLAATLYASVIILNKFIKNIDDYKRTFIQLLTASLVLLPLIIYKNPIIFKDLKSILLMLILGIFHTGIAYCLYFSAIKDLKAQSIAILGYIDPASSVLFSIILLREPFSIWQLIGGIIILVSAYVAERKPNKEKIKEVQKQGGLKFGKNYKC